MNVDLSAAPDLTMQGLPLPAALAGASGSPHRSPTIGQVAALVHDLSASPRAWWHLLRFDRERPDRIPLDTPAGYEAWLLAWPPGHRVDRSGHGPAPEVLTVVAGELAEVTIGPAGTVTRMLRANRVRVHGGAHMRELANPGPAYAVTVHARVHGR